MKWICLLSSYLLFQLSLHAQSISGNLNSAATNSGLSYGNVDIYKGNKLVASVLTDKAGNFNVALDTGTYRCVVNYAGFTSVTKEIRVSKDEKADFSIKEDPSKLKMAERKPSMSPRFGFATSGTETSSDSIRTELIEGVYLVDHIPSKRMIPYESVGGLGYDGLFDTGKIPNLGGTSGALTAGEINDFAKWRLWQDIVSSELTAYQTAWNIAPSGRYTVHLQNQTGLPLADAVVQLKEKNGNVLFTTRTDNTGTAECWLTIKNTAPDLTSRLNMEIHYQGKTTQITRVTPFEESINHVVLQVNCAPIENVDIAFVVDATGSMGDELSYLQAEINDIIFQSKQISSTLNFRFANVFYRDQGLNEAYLTRTMDFNRILTESTAYIDQQSAGGGGDYEEAVEIALDSAINRLGWSDEARTRILFLILDAPPHNTTAVQQKWEVLIRQAAAKGIRIVPIGASGINKSTEYLMRTLALGTNGTYTFLTNHSGIGNPHIDPSTDRYDVETLNKLLVRILKSYTYMPDCEQNLPELQWNIPDSIVSYPQPVDSTDSSHTTQLPTADSLHIRWNYYPNPTNGLVTVLPDTDIDELYLTDLSGKVLQILRNLTKDRRIQVDLSNYATGMYLLRYPVGKSWVSGKIILQRTS